MGCSLLVEKGEDTRPPNIFWVTGQKSKIWFISWFSNDSGLNFSFIHIIALKQLRSNIEVVAIYSSPINFYLISAIVVQLLQCNVTYAMISQSKEWMLILKPPTIL